MTKWDNLPNEILELIIDASVKQEDVEKVKWMMVNKQWYDQYQSIKYENVSIRLDGSSCTVLNNITHSQFETGKWIRTMSFQSLKAPTTASSYLCDPGFRSDDDPLYLLVIHSPHVTYVV